MATERVKTPEERVAYWCWLMVLSSPGRELGNMTITAANTYYLNHYYYQNKTANNQIKH